MLANTYELRVQRLNLLDRLDSIRAAIIVDRLVDAAEVADEFRALFVTYQTACAAVRPDQDQAQTQYA